MAADRAGEENTFKFIRWMLRWRAAAEVRVIRSRHRDQIRRISYDE